MGRNKGSFIITLLVMFLLFLSLISIVFNLVGLFAKLELVFLLVTLLSAMMLTGSIVGGRGRWRGLTAFYMVQMVNLFAVYLMTFGLKQILLPFIAVWLGFITAIIKVEPVARRRRKPAEEKRSQAGKKAAARRKPAKKKAAKKKAKRR